jgi:hypothetical protein
VKSSARFGGAAFLETEWKRVKVISYFLKAVLKGREMLIKCKLFLFFDKNPNRKASKPMDKSQKILYN